MKIEYILNHKDYLNASLENLKIEIRKRIVYIFIIPFTISLIIAGKPFDWKLFTTYFITSFLLFFIFLFIRNIFSIYQNYNLIKNNPLYFDKKMIVLEEDGILYGIKEPIKYNWSSIFKVINLSNYIILILENSTSIIIAKKGLQSEEIANFLGVVKSYIHSEEKNSNPKRAKNNYWLGLFGFIPNFGIIIGAILIFKGFKRKDTKLKILGLANILFTPLFWLFFINYINNSSTIKEANIEFTIYDLNEIVKDLEYYKSKNGNYPDSLGQLRNQNKFLNDYEIFIENSFLKTNKPVKFYYKKVNNHYELKSYGPDRILNTDDDILPKFK